MQADSKVYLKPLENFKITNLTSRYLKGENLISKTTTYFYLM